MLTIAKLDARRHRWLAMLSLYNFDIRYKSGQHNVDADVPPQDAEESQEIDQRITTLIESDRIWSDEFKV